MDDLEGVKRALVRVEVQLKVICYRTGLTPAELKRQLDEAIAWADQQNG
jgi:hypothetical protein